MSVSSIIAAMRSDRPPAERIVWQCLENHANGAGWWAITEEEIAAELHMSYPMVRRAIAALALDGIIRIERHKRRKTVFHMERSNTRRKPTQTSQPHADLTAQNGGVNLSTQLNLTAHLIPPQMSSPRAGLESKKDISPKRKKDSSSKRPKAFDGNSEFAEFWKNYPRKVGKRAAAKAWTMATKRASPATIMAGLATAQWNPDPQFVPHPSTWLNQDRWADEPTAPKRTLREEWNLPSFLNPNHTTDDDTPPNPPNPRRLS